jgi:hypothetical protein
MQRVYSFGGITVEYGQGWSISIERFSQDKTPVLTVGVLLLG